MPDERFTLEAHIEASADTGGFESLKTDLRDLRVNLDELSAKNVSIQIDADTTAAKAKIDELRNISGTVTINVDADTTAAKAKIDELRNISGAVTINIDADTTAARAKIDELRNVSGTVTMKVDADTTAAKAKIDELRNISGTVTINVDADTAAARAKIEELRSAGFTITINVNVDEGAAIEKLTQIEAEKVVVGKDVHININVDTGGAEEKFAQVAASEVAVESSSSSLGGALSGLASSFGLMGVAVVAVIAAVAPLAAVLIALTAAAGALAIGIALVAAPFLIMAANANEASKDLKENETQQKAVEAASKALQDAQNQLAQASQRVGEAQQQAAERVAQAQKSYQEALQGAADARKRLTEAEQGVADAQAAAQDRLNSATKTYQNALDGVTQAQKALQQAQQGVADAEQAAQEKVNQAVEQYQQAVQQAHDTAVQAAKADQQAQEQLQQAIRGVGTAEEQLQQARQQETTATNSLRDAVSALNEAYATEQERIDRLSLNMQGLALTQKQNALDIAQAEQQLAKDRQAGQGLQVQQDMLRIQQLQLAQKTNTLDQQDAQRALNQAQANGTTELQSAQKAATSAGQAQQQAARGVQNAQQGVQDAYHRVGQASQNVADTQQKGAQQVQNANQRVATAAQNITKAYQDGQRQISQAQQRVADAVDNVRKANARVADAAQGITKAYQDGQRQISQAQSRVQDALQGVQRANQRVADAAQNVTKAYTDGQRQIQQAMQQQAQAQQRVEDATNRLNDTLKQQAPLATGLEALWQKFGPQVTAAFQPAIQQAKLFGNDLTNLGQSVLPALGQASATTLAGLRQGFNQAVQEVSPNVANSFGGILKILPSFMSNLGSAAVHAFSGILGFVNDLSPQIAAFGRWVDSIAKGFDAWANSDGTRQAIQDWFQRMKGPLKDLQDALGNLTTEVIRFYNVHGPALTEALAAIVRGASTLVSFITDHVVPILKSMWQAVKDVDQILGGGSKSSGVNQSLQAFGDELDYIQKVINNDVLPALDALKKALPDIGVSAATARKAVAIQLDLLTGNFGKLYDDLVGNSIIPDIVNGVVEWFTGLPTKIVNALVGLVEQVSKPFTDAWNWISQTLSNWATDIYTLGKNVMTGFTNGLIDAWNSASGEVSKIWDAIKQGASRALGVHSPSTEMHYIGRMAGLGFVEGLRSQISPAEAAAKELANAAKPHIASLGIPGIPLWRSPDAPGFASGAFGMSQGQTSGLPSAPTHQDFGSLEKRLDRLSEQMEDLIGTTAAVGPSVKGSVDYNLEHDRVTQGAAARGLPKSAEARRQMYVNREIG